MQCPRCQHESPSSAKFCPECGARLAPACAGCGTELPAGAKFCLECGQPASGNPPPPRNPGAYTPKHLAEKILTSRAALEGERKQVTVLLADVKGSMELAEQVDPEEWHGIMDRFFQILADGVHRFEGTVNQYTGDGIMALFGAPIAHEDHAQRACWAALHLQDGLRRYAEELRRTRGLGFSVRLGLNSGEVVVGRIGDDLRMDYTAQGHTVGLAARMEQLAAPDQAYLSDHTAALVAGFFRLRDLGLFTLKGVREPLRVHELEGIGSLRTRLDVSRARGFSRFVGRLDEMAALEAALARALEGDGQVVGVVADAGVGKSRLCFEFLERCRGRGIVTYQASGVAHGKSVPFLPILELWRDYFGITAADSAAVAREKIAGRLLLLDRALDEVLPVVFDFLGVSDPERLVPPMESEARQRQLFELIRRVIQLRGRREPTVTLLEDLHWFDSGSEAFLTPLVEARSGTRALLVVNFRPEYRADWMQKSYYQQLPLRSLGAEAADELLRELLGTDPSLAGLPARIRERTGGNPFFIEEVVRALDETGGLVGQRGTYRLVRPVEAIAVPGSVQAVLAARIDRLAEREKAVLQTAAVIGQEFGEGLLGRVTTLPEPDLSAALRALVTAEFLYPSALFPEGEYTFTHPLTREVSYGSQLAERRARVHAAVARAIEEIDSRKLGERAALLAYHWEQGGDAREAMKWHRGAAEWVGFNNSAEALRHLGSVRQLLDTLPETAENLAERAAVRAQIMIHLSRMGDLEDQATSLFREGRELATRSGDPHVLSQVLNGFGVLRFFTGALEEALDPLLEAIRRADETGDMGLRVAVRYSLTSVHSQTPQLRELLATAEEGLRFAQGDLSRGADRIGFSPTLGLSSFHGFALSLTGRPRDGAAELNRVIELARASQQLQALYLSHVFHVNRCEVMGEAAPALAHGREAVNYAERMGSQFSRLYAYLTLGLANVLNRAWHDALKALEQALAIGRERRLLLAEGGVLAVMAAAHLGLGDRARARELADEAIAVGRGRGTRFWECSAQLTRIRALRETSGVQATREIEAALAEADTWIEMSGAKSYAPFLHVECAELARLTGDEASRERELHVAQRLFTEMGATARAERLAKELGL